MCRMPSNKGRYQTDPEFRAAEQARAKEYYHRTKRLIHEKTGPKARPFEERFWEKVDKRSDDECWLWIGASRNKSTYGSLSIDGRPVPAYRASWIIHFGELASDRYVRISCHNKLCVNPAHLYLDNLSSIRPKKVVSLTEEQAFQKRVEASERARIHYAANADKIRIENAEYQMRNKIKAVNYLGGKCTKCGFNHPSALQFHHRDPATKLFSITSKELSTPKKRPWGTMIVPELDKCDLLCSNCHFLTHAALTPERVRELQEINYG